MLQPTNSPKPPHSPLQTSAPSSSPASPAASPAPAPDSLYTAPSSVSLTSPYVASSLTVPYPVQFHLQPHHGHSHNPYGFSATSPSSAVLVDRSGGPSATSTPRLRFHSPRSSKKRMSRSVSTSSMQHHADVASVTSRNYSNLYSPQHNLYSHLYSHSSASSTSDSTASSFSFHPARTYPSSSMLPVFASIHMSPESTSHDLSAPPSPTSSSRSRTLGIGAGVGGLATAGLLPAYRTLQPLEVVPAPVRVPPTLSPSLQRPALPPQPAYAPSILHVTDDKDDDSDASTPTADDDEHDPEMASLSSSSSISLSRLQPSTPTLSRFRPARSPSIVADAAPVARDDFVFAELDPREPLPVWHPGLRSVYSL